MSFTILAMPQRSPEWVQARLGRLTGSCAADMLASVKGGEAIGRRQLREQLARERIDGRPHQRPFESAIMRSAVEQEPAARAWYEALTGRFVRTTGFIVHDELQVGVSLDGHVGDFEGIIEIKCPLALTHAGYVGTSKIPGVYHKQMVHALWVTGAPWCDFVSFNPEFPPALRACVVRIHRNEREIASYALAATMFLREVDAEELQRRVA